MGRRSRRRAKGSSGGSPQPSFDLRHQRAVQQLDDLERAVKGWLKTDAYTLTDEFDPNAEDNVIKVTPGEPPRSEWGTAIGEVLHNLRSALDHLVFALGEAYYGPLPKDMAETSGFPIFAKEPPGVRNFCEKVGCLDPCAQAVIERLQPHHRGDGYVTDDLFVLNELWNLDKHRQPPLTLFALVQTSIGFPGQHFYAEYIRTVGGGRIEGETELLRYRIEVLPGSDEVDMKRTVEFDVAFGQGTPAEGHPVVPKLRDLANCVQEGVFDPLRQYL